MKRLDLRSNALYHMDKSAQRRTTVQVQKKPQFSLQQPSAFHQDEIIKQHGKCDWSVTTKEIMKIAAGFILHMKRFRIPLYTHDQNTTSVYIRHTRGRITYPELKYLLRRAKHYCATENHSAYINYEYERMRIKITPVEVGEVFFTTDDYNQKTQLTPWQLFQLSKT